MTETMAKILDDPAAALPKSSGRLTRAQLLEGAGRYPTKSVYVARLGGYVEIGALTYGKQLRANEMATKLNDKRESRVDEREAQTYLMLSAFEDPKLEPTDGAVISGMTLGEVTEVIKAALENSGIAGADGARVLDAATFTQSPAGA